MFRHTHTRETPWTIVRETARSEPGSNPCDSKDLQAAGDPDPQIVGASASLSEYDEEDLFPTLSPGPRLTTDDQLLERPRRALSPCALGGPVCPLAGAPGSAACPRGHAGHSPGPGPAAGCAALQLDAGRLESGNSQSVRHHAVPPRAHRPADPDRGVQKRAVVLMIWAGERLRLAAQIIHERSPPGGVDAFGMLPRHTQGSLHPAPEHLRLGQPLSGAGIASSRWICQLKRMSATASATETSAPPA